jgi:hypothetical protein
LVARSVWQCNAEGARVAATAGRRDRRIGPLKSAFGTLSRSRCPKQVLRLLAGGDLLAQGLPRSVDPVDAGAVMFAAKVNTCVSSILDHVQAFCGQ